MHSVHKVWYKMGIQLHPDQRGWWMESGIPNTPRPLQTPHNVLWPHKLAHYIPSNDEQNLQNGSGPRMAISIHGWHCHSHKTTQWRNGTTTQTTNSSGTWKARRTWPIPQTRKMQVLKARNRVPRSHCGKQSPENEPKETGKHQELGDT